MNQEQRKFLIARIEKAYKDETAKISEDLPNEPNLNNYLVAAILDNSIQLKPLDEIKKSIREKVLSLGIGDSLTNKPSAWGRSNESNHEVTLKADIVFIYPKAYLQAYEEFQRKKKEITDKIAKLYAQKETLLLKVNIGSNQTLDRLIDEVDNMIDISLMNNKLMLKE
jgi:hypothetical protein